MQKTSAQKLCDDLEFSHSEDQIVTELQNLLNSGELDINASDGLRCTALHDAAYRDRVKVVAWLIKNGADVNAKDYSKYTPLHKASSFGNTAVAKLLIKNGADVDARNSIGDTPLHLASFWGKAEVAKLLLDKGADINSKNDLGSSLVDWAYKNKHPATIKVLEKHIDKSYGLDNPDQYADFVKSSLVDRATTNENDY